ncbi:GAF domain-containing sensor histidine kinase [Nostoc sp.]
MELLPNSQPTITQEALLYRIANRIRHSLELKEILDTTVAEVRAYLETDRVKVYQFSSDGSGVVIAESIQENRLPSLLGLHFPADDIPLYARELFVRARQRSIVDITTCSIGLSPLLSSDTGEPIDEKEIRYRPVDPCHIEYLTAMEVKSSVVVPIVLEAQQTAKNHPSSLRSTAQLWGLLVSHHSESRNVTQQELVFIQGVVDQVEIAITHSMLLNLARSQAQIEANINRITSLLYASQRVVWAAALEEVVKTFNGAGGRLYLFSYENQPVELYLSGSQPEPLNKELDRVIEENLLWQNFLSSVIETNADQTGYKPWSVEWMRTIYNFNETTKDIATSLNLWAIEDLYREPLFRTLAPFFQSTKIRSLLIIPLNHGNQIVGCLTIFRQEIDIEILWAGWNNPDARQLTPRQSFQVWRQQKIGQTQAWTEEEIKYAQTLSERISATVKQYRLYQQIQAFTTTLEQQVQERTEQQQILFNIVAKIRESLDLNTIFNKTAFEVRNFLNADRVGVFCFEPNSGFNQGEFVSEDVLPKFPSALVAKVNDHCFGEQFAVEYHKGRIQVVADINNDGLKDCHIAVLSQFQIKAQIIVPLMKGTQLWGLLCIHQCDQTRNWQDIEIQFIKQIATQLGIAIEQADLLAQTKYQARQLANALQDLQATQSKLIQTEKMSSLGQLVAGIAHEINNPVNFIHGNLTHVEEYVHNLLKFISILQTNFSQPRAEILELAAELDLDFIIQDLPKTLSSMKIGTERITEIVLSLRNFSRLDQAELKAVDIHEGIDSTLLILEHRLKIKSNVPKIQLIKEYGNLPNVECYAGLLNQVIMNILSNAIDALEQRDIELFSAHVTRTKLQFLENANTIWIRTKTLDCGRVAIHIKDNGIGIAEEVQKNIFNPFFTTKPVGKGTGLGLSISYQIITETHQGELKCVSKLEEGTEFIIEIPIQQNFN